jgi:hypothetical protein
MKKRANTISWPYIAPVVLDWDNKIGTMAESIICSERLDACKFVVLAAFEMANADIDSTKIIFGDGIMWDRLLEDLGIADVCKLCHHEYHLIMEDWPRQFGPTLWAVYEEKMRLLLYSDREEVYNHHCAGMRESLKSRRLKDYFENEIHSKRKRFVR